MSKIIILSLIIAAIVAVGVWYGATTYNRLVLLDEAVISQWSQVENVYQRRLDLIPNLVETVKGYAEHEKDTLIQITEMRSRALSAMKEIHGSPTAEQLAVQAKIQSEVTGSLRALYAVAENYPTLKASNNFITLQSQLEGTENRIAVERMRFNETVKAYNMSIRKFPAKLTATLLGFSPKDYFEAVAEAKQAPKVKFTQ